MIRVVSVGNGAGNIVDQLRINKIFPDVEFVYCDTDVEMLNTHGVETDKHVHLTPNMDKVRADVHSNNDIATILICCLGGKTTTKYALEIAWELCDYSDKTYCLASIPALYEGSERRANAMNVFENITKVWKKCEIAVLQDNDKIPGSLNTSQIDNGIMCFLNFLLSHPKKGASVVKDERPFVVRATKKHALVALRGLYCNNPELSEYYGMQTFSLHSDED